MTENSNSKSNSDGSDQHKTMADRLKAVEGVVIPPKTESETGVQSDTLTRDTTHKEEEHLLEDDSHNKDLLGLAKELEAAKAKAEENLNAYLRVRADIENIQRRAAIDVENTRKYGIERFAREMLVVVDSLEQGLQVADSAKDTAYHEGMALTLKLCLDIFDKFGIKRIDPAMGDAFDPLRHEAISAQVRDDMEPNKILVVAQKGFILQDRVLRPARVIVTRKE